MQMRDRAADCKSKPNAADVSLNLAALEFLE
jgi:hypothetical protein